jgi:hypothetical protein
MANQRYSGTWDDGTRADLVVVYNDPHDPRSRRDFMVGDGYLNRVDGTSNQFRHYVTKEKFTTDQDVR